MRGDPNGVSLCRRSIPTRMCGAYFTCIRNQRYDTHGKQYFGRAVQDLGYRWRNESGKFRPGKSFVHKWDRLPLDLRRCGRTAKHQGSEYRVYRIQTADWRVLLVNSSNDDVERRLSQRREWQHQRLHQSASAILEYRRRQRLHPELSERKRHHWDLSERFASPHHR